MGIAFSVDVGDGGNQRIVAVGDGVSAGTGVSVAVGAAIGRQAARSNVMMRNVSLADEKFPRQVGERCVASFDFAPLRSPGVHRDFAGRVARMNTVSNLRIRE